MVGWKRKDEVVRRLGVAVRAEAFEIGVAKGPSSMRSLRLRIQEMKGCAKRNEGRPRDKAIRKMPFHARRLQCAATDS